MSNQVPFGFGQVAQSVRLARKLLHPVLAENAQPGGVCLADVFDGKSLAHAHQCNFIRTAVRPARRSGDPLLHACDVFSYRHEENITTAAKEEGRSGW